MFFSFLSPSFRSRTCHAFLMVAFLPSNISPSLFFPLHPLIFSVAPCVFFLYIHLAFSLQSSLRSLVFRLFFVISVFRCLVCAGLHLFALCGSCLIAGLACRASSLPVAPPPYRRTLPAFLPRCYFIFIGGKNSVSGC